MVLAPSPGRLTVITGPSGVGKGTLVAALRQRQPSIWLSISATTRSPRSGEQDGEHYFFLSRDDFEARVAAGGLLEWAEFAGHCYGTPRQPVQDQLDAGRPVLLEIELEGARQVRRSFPEGFQIFIKPPPSRSWSAGFGAAAPTVRPRSTGAWSGPGSSWRRKRNSMRFW
jgi:guanylate kinase